MCSHKTAGPARKCQCKCKDQRQETLIHILDIVYRFPKPAIVDLGHLMTLS